jgi:hypothetical protein
MRKRILAVVLGLLAGFAVTGLVEALSSVLYPLPPGFDMNDMEAFRRHVEGLPIGAFLIVLVAHELGAFAGGFACARLAGVPWPVGPIVVGTLLMAAGVVNLLTIPHPAWFVVVDLLAYLPMAILGGQLGRRALPSSVAPATPAA